MSLWVEKYRPKTFSEVIGQGIIVERIAAMVENKNIQNMIFAGPAGIGKTSIALIIARELYQENWRENILDLNASNTRGIDVIRSTIRDFARTKALNTNLPKLIFLDEADALTKEAQHALRRTMETYSNTARFILSCNFQSKLIDPIQSRCIIFRFKPLEKNDIKHIINKIAKEEKLKINQEAIDLLYEFSEGDVRKVENILQSTAVLNKNITEQSILDVIAYANPNDILNILNIALKGDFIRAREKLMEVMLKQGLSGIDIIKQIQKEIWNLDINNEQKISLIEKCGETEFRMVEGSDEFVQLEALLANFTIKK